MSSKPEEFAEPFCKFLQENPTVFHAVGYFKKKMGALGYKEVGVLRGYSFRGSKLINQPSSLHETTGPASSRLAASTT